MGLNFVIFLISYLTHKSVRSTNWDYFFFRLEKVISDPPTVHRVCSSETFWGLRDMQLNIMCVKVLRAVT